MDRLFSDDRGVSPVVGVVLIVAASFIIIGLILAVALMLATGSSLVAATKLLVVLLGLGFASRVALGYYKRHKARKAVDAELDD